MIRERPIWPSYALSLQRQVKRGRVGKEQLIRGRRAVEKKERLLAKKKEHKVKKGQKFSLWERNGSDEAELTVILRKSVSLSSIS